MKTFKQIVAEIQSFNQDAGGKLVPLLWRYICYSPKMPARLQQQQLLDDAQTFPLKVTDNHFAKKDLQFNTFKWGTGKHKILLTHGWASKAADLSDIITALRELHDVQIIAFDAPGNGSSEGGLSNLLLYIEAVKATVTHYGHPAVTIGHSLGAMANIMALQQLQIEPSLLISVTPLVKLKENFEASMNAVGITTVNQQLFFQSFRDVFKVDASAFNLTDQYHFNPQLNHWIVYDHDDQVSPYTYLHQFAALHPSIQIQNYNGEGHHKILKSPALINDLINKVNLTLLSIK